MAVKFINRYNTQLHPVYKMFSWDLLFYYAIIYLFLTLEKGLSASEVLFIDALCQITKLIFQLPCVGIIDLLKNKKGLILANILCAISILLLIMSKDIFTIVISNIIFAISYNLRQLCESSILYDTIPEHKSKNRVFTKIDGMGQSKYYYLDAFSAVIAGFLFIVNNYIPLILCFICCCISTCIACKFKEEKEENTHDLNKHHTISIREYIKELKNIYKFIFQSKRLKCLLLYSGLFTGVLMLFINLRSIVLTEVDLQTQYFGIALAIIQIISAISSKQTHLIQSKLRNKTLTIIAAVNVFPLILIGLSLACNFPFSVNLIIIAMWLILYSITKGPFYTLIKRYLQSFSTPEVTTKIYGLQTILNSIFATLFSLFSALLLKYISVASTLIIIGSILSTVFLILLDYMKSYVGLKPEEYEKSEITYVKLK